MKKYFYMFFGIFCFWTMQNAFAINPLSQEELKSVIIPSSSNDILTAKTSWETGTSFLDAILGFARDSIFTLLILLAIGMFIFIWGKLIIARWNPEEFKKALVSFVYAIVGIFVVSIAWAVVRLITGIEI